MVGRVGGVVTPSIKADAPETDPRVRRRMDEVMRHARRTFRHSLPREPLWNAGPWFDPEEPEGSLHGSAPWATDPIEPLPGRLWSPASWFATLGVAGAVPLVIVYWMLH